MKIKEQTIRELDSLRPEELFIIHELILSLKGKSEYLPEKTDQRGYQQARNALKSCQGLLSDDIILMREDRI